MLVKTRKLTSARRWYLNHASCSDVTSFYLCFFFFFFKFYILGVLRFFKLLHEILLCLYLHTHNPKGDAALSHRPRHSFLPRAQSHPPRPQSWAHGSRALDSAAPGTLPPRGAAGVQRSLPDCFFNWRMTALQCPASFCCTTV